MDDDDGSDDDDDAALMRGRGVLEASDSGDEGDGSGGSEQE